jgi:hypothetical protein
MMQTTLVDSGPLMKLGIPILATLACLAIASSGCSGSDSGTLAVHATDAPDNIGDFSSLTINVDAIRVQGPAGNQSYSPAHPSFDLVTLTNGNLTTLFNGTVAAGDYNYLEIHITSADGVLAEGGSHVSVAVSSSRIFLNSHFTVTAGKQTDFVFDIHVLKEGNGQYRLLPSANTSHVGR